MKHVGDCYPSDGETWLAEWEAGIDSELNRHGASTPSTDLLGIVMPHIDFRVNRSLYYRAFLPWFISGHIPETVIILGVGHRCPHEISTHPYSCQTPLGILEADEDVWKEWNERCPDFLSRSPRSFIGEHSIEFAAAALAAASTIIHPERATRILPVLCGGLHDFLARGEMPQEGDEYYEIGAALGVIIKEGNSKQIGFLVSIDGCHVGPRFDHPFEGSTVTQRAVRNWEDTLWQEASHDRFEAFFNHLAPLENMFYFDGVGALSLLLQHQSLRVCRTGSELWFEKYDQSFVTFSSGTIESTANE